MNSYSESLIIESPIIIFKLNVYSIAVNEWKLKILNENLLISEKETFIVCTSLFNRAMLI